MGSSLAKKGQERRDVEQEILVKLADAVKVEVERTQRE